MITIRNACQPDGKICNLSIASHEHLTIDASGLTILPGLIDPHVHFRTPGLETKENWVTGAQAAIRGGYTMVFDMPNTLPPTTTVTHLKAKHHLITTQLAQSSIPLGYKLFIGADKNHLGELSKVGDLAIGIKIFMGCSTGNLVIDDADSLKTAFMLAAQHQMLVAVHAEDEARLNQRKQEFHNPQYSDHSLIRDSISAAIAVEQAINLTRVSGAKLYILHVSSAAELQLIRAAKQEGLPVYAETTPHHLFLNSSAYHKLAGFAVVNPPLRTKADNQALWAAIADGTIDTIGSDHAPHTKEEKYRPYGQCPSGMPGIETTLALLLNAYNEGLISLEKIISLTSVRIKEIFHLPATQDIVLVDLNKKLPVIAKNLKTKCGWSAFDGMILRGWPVYTILNGSCFNVASIENFR